MLHGIELDVGVVVGKHSDALDREDAPSRNVATAEPWWKPRHVARLPIERVDRYTITVGGARIRADASVEARLRAMPDDELRRFMTVMGHG